MFVLLYMVCTNIGLGILEKNFVFMFVLFYMVCKNVSLGILETIICVYVYVFV